MRRGARRLPQLSQRANGAVGSMTPSGAVVGTSINDNSLLGLPPDQNTPAAYWATYSEDWELLRRVWRLEQTATSAGVVVPSSMYNGKLTASLCLLRWPSTETFTFPAGLTASQGIARIAATAQTDCDIQLNAVSFGTMRWAAAGTVPTFISASGSAVVPGDIVEVFAPATPDATLASIGFGLRGTRT